MIGTCKIIEKIFEPRTQQKIEDIKGYTIKYGNIVENGEVIDEVLVSYFKAPKSYTTENMCEINSHGGNVIVRKILEICFLTVFSVMHSSSAISFRFLSSTIF